MTNGDGSRNVIWQDGNMKGKQIDLSLCASPSRHSLVQPEHADFFFHQQTFSYGKKSSNPGSKISKSDSIQIVPLHNLTPICNYLPLFLTPVPPPKRKHHKYETEIMGKKCDNNLATKILWMMQDSVFKELQDATIRDVRFGI